MLAIEAPFAGGIGYVVPAGAPEMTGVLLLELCGSLLLHADNRISPQRKMLMQRRRGAKIFLWFSFAPLRLCVRTNSDFFVLVILLLLRERFTGDAILTFYPLAEIDKLAPLRTEGTKRIIFPVDWLTAGWTFHES
jgi:hypothetical protein